MNIDEELDTLLHRIGDGYPLPGEGPARVRAITADRPRPSLSRRLPRLSRRTWLLTAAAAVLVLVVGVTVAGTASQPGPASVTTAPAVRTGQAAVGGPAASAPSVPVPSAGGTNAAPRATGGSTLPVPSGTRIVMTGTATLQAPANQVQTELALLADLAVSYGGYVQSSQLSTGGDTPTGTETLRVPVAHFSDLTGALHRYGRVVSMSTSSQDVTGQYVDLTARIAALQTSRATYLTILSRATTIGDVLSVQQQVDGIQQQIDELQGEQKVLADQSDMSALTVMVAPHQLVAPPTSPQPENGLKHALLRGWRGFLHGVEGLLSALGPTIFILLCLAVLLLLGRLVWRRLRRAMV